MWARPGLLLVLLLLLAWPASVSYATPHPNPIGYGTFTSTTGVAGTVYVGNLDSGETHFSLRLTGAAVATSPVWRLTAGGVTLINDQPLTSSSLGIAYSAVTIPTTVPVSAVGSPPVGVTVTVYESATGPAVASAFIKSLPDSGTSHSW